jgi:hypothetical protein
MRISTLTTLFSLCRSGSHDIILPCLTLVTPCSSLAPIQPVQVPALALLICPNRTTTAIAEATRFGMVFICVDAAPLTWLRLKTWEVKVLARVVLVDAPASEVNRRATKVLHHHPLIAPHVWHGTVVVEPYYGNLAAQLVRGWEAS